MHFLELSTDFSTLVYFFKKQILREFLIHIRQPKRFFHAALFFLMVVVFFPLTLSSDISLIRYFAPGVIWIAALLALFLSSLGLFQQDYDDGLLEEWVLSGYPLSLMMRAKLIVHWLLNAMVLLLLCPCFALLFHLTFYETMVLILSLFCGTPAILLLCGLCAAFNTGKKGMLMALVLFPLVLPVMIFGSGTLSTAMEGNPASGYLALLTAISLVTFGFLPFAIAGILRISLVD